MTCTKCSTLITELDFMDDEGNLLCEDCFEKWLENKEDTQIITNYERKVCKI